MKEYKITFHATIYKTMEIEILAESEELAKDAFWDDLECNVAMADTIHNRQGYLMENIEAEIEKVELLGEEEDYEDDLSCN